VPLVKIEMTPLCEIPFVAIYRPSDHVNLNTHEITEIEKLKRINILYIKKNIWSS
jgi:hypothetical protein